jgi:choline dehydrogenase
MSQSYDFIIIGAGSAGCVLANRLSENPDTRVLLLEAGGSDLRFTIKMPLGYAFTFVDPKVNWMYSAAPEETLKGRSGYWPRGKVIGGSSSINAMAYFRGLPKDFDDWEKAGATGWNWKSVEATYQSLETHISKGMSEGTGPVCVSDLSSQMHPFSEHFLSAAKEMGLNVPENTAVSHDGWGYVRSTMKNGKRFSAADAFLHPVRHRKNLTIVKKAMVQRLTISDARATGVIFRHKGRSIHVSASKEIILSAGAIGSPQLLQVSGVGPKEVLENANVPVVHAMPEVGQGLQDHLAITQYFDTDERTLNDEIGGIVGRVVAGIRYLLTRKGPLSVPVNQTSGFARSGPDVETADLQLYANPIAYSVGPTSKPVVGKKSGFLLSAQPARSTSRGSVNISSPDTDDAPEIRPNSLATEHDRDMAIRAGRMVQAMARTAAMKSVTTAYADPEFLKMDDDALLDMFRKTALTVFHPCCTCRMGSSAKNSVVDARLRVHGLSGLRVVDASAFPNITSGNTNAPTMMLAQRGAEMILEDH